MNYRFSPDDLRGELGSHTMSVPRPTEGAVSLGSQRGALRTGDHAAMIYWRPEELLDCVVPYLAAGLAAGDRVIYVADDLTVEQIATALTAAGVDVPTHTAAGRLLLVTSDAAFFADGVFDPDRAIAGVRGLAAEAVAAGVRLRVSVEMTYLLATVPGIERGPEYESRVNAEVYANYPITCICSFNATRATSREIISEVLSTHPILIASGTPLLNPHYRDWASRQPR